MTPNDPLYAQQWHFALIGDIETIWNEFTGDGVTVAVYDEGVQYTHPDLAANYDASMHLVENDFVYDGAPIFSDHAHGTACAGLIGAVANNGVGGVGVAFDVMMTSVNYLEVIQYGSAALMEAGLLWAANFDVMSNSWGYSDQFLPEQNLSDRFSDAALIDDGYEAIAALGRGGLGTVVVQAAGNDAVNANSDGINVSRFTITVAATEDTGIAATYSNWGPNILVAAPAASVTTDMLANAGYNTDSDADPINRDYTSDFNGTSAATPVVAGVVALMLEANADLGWRDVHNILAMSAGHTGSALGGPADLDEVDVWRVTGGNQWNGGGNGFHANYGFGMVDAFAAVRMAEAWLVMQGPARTTANEVVRNLVSNQGASVLPDFDPVSGNGTLLWNKTAGFAMEIETIYVTVEITHSYAPDLILTLIAPDGVEVTLMANEQSLGAVGSNDLTDLMDGGFRWTFAVEALRGYSSLGDWTLRVEDTFAGDTGFISDFDLKFFGARASSNDVFHFTDDYLDYLALDASRAVIDDVNGGVDWLNFSAINGDIVANLNANSVITVDGVAWATLSSDNREFENLHAGDGDDNIIGNASANRLYGARGADTMSGGNGADVLDGGSGADRLLGGNGNDTLRGGAGIDFLDGGRNNDSLTGGDGVDIFVFASGYGVDVITDFMDNIDTLRLNDNLWAGVLTVQQVINTYGINLGGGGVLLDFGAAELTFAGLADRQLLIDDITII